MDLSEQPDNEDLKARFNKAYEKATRKFLETRGNENFEEGDKRLKTQDTRSQSKQGQSGARGSNESEEIGMRKKQEPKGQHPK